MKRHSDSAQLNFFAILEDPAPVFGEVVMFPADRWIGEMRAVASRLLMMPGHRDRDHYWKRFIQARERKLRTLGIPAEEVRRQFLAFRIGVQCQARRQVILEILHDQHGGAA